MGTGIFKCYRLTAFGPVQHDGFTQQPDRFERTTNVR